MTGTTSSNQTSLVGRTRRFHLYVFDDEQRHNVLKEFLVVLRCERDTILLHDLTQGLEERHKNDIQGPIISFAGFRSNHVQQVRFLFFEILFKATTDETSNASSCKRPSRYVILSYRSGRCLCNLPSFGRNIAGFNGERGDHHREDLSKREMHGSPRRTVNGTHVSLRMERPYKISLIPDSKCNLPVHEKVSAVLLANGNQRSAIYFFNDIQCL